jgi:hypothetical protein
MTGPLSLVESGALGHLEGLLERHIVNVYSGKANSALVSANVYKSKR